MINLLAITFLENTMSHLKLSALFLVTASLFAVSTSALAHTQKDVVIQGKSETHKIYVAPEELTPFIGNYQLETGKNMSIVRVQNRLYAQIEDQEKMELTATDENEFRVKKNNIQFQFANMPSGKALDVKINYPTNTMAINK
jgi:hypothetical protein